MRLKQRVCLGEGGGPTTVLEGLVAVMSLLSSQMRSCGQREMRRFLQTPRTSSLGFCARAQWRGWELVSQWGSPQDPVEEGAWSWGFEENIGVN